VAATKTYLNSVAAVALLSTADDAQRLGDLLAMPKKVDEQIEQSLAAAGALDRYREVEGGSVVARGVNYGAAFEIALKIRELSGAQFEAFSSADLLHGPIAALKSGRPAIVIAPAGRTLASMSVALEKVRERGAEVIAISDDEKFLSESDTALPLVPGVPEWLTPLLTVVPGQIAAVRLATLRDANVDSPVGLTKITLTR
jgi:glucosamine--fructose-6-phosphate aminotransferase (isomerizing)